MNVALKEVDLDEMGLSEPIKSNQVPAVQECQSLQVLPGQTDDTALMGAILAASSNPAVDADKMDRLLATYRSIKADNAKTEYYRALAVLKPELPVIGRNGRIEVREKTASGKRDGVVQQSTGYALWEDIDEAITPIIAEHGFTLTFRAGQTTDGRITVTAVLAHRAGHIDDQTTITLPHDSSGSKNNVQAVGSSLSYGKRYAATLVLNIRTRGEDDDGRAAGAGATLNTDQLATIYDLIERSKADRKDFCKYMKVERVEDILHKDFGQAVTALNTKLHRSAKQKEAAK